MKFEGRQNRTLIYNENIEKFVLLYQMELLMYFCFLLMSIRRFIFVLTHLFIGYNKFYCNSNCNTYACCLSMCLWDYTLFLQKIIIVKDK